MILNLAPVKVGAKKISKLTATNTLFSSCRYFLLARVYFLFAKCARDHKKSRADHWPMIAPNSLALIISLLGRKLDAQKVRRDDAESEPRAVTIAYTAGKVSRANIKAASY
jgi:hypothetical protein